MEDPRIAFEAFAAGAEAAYAKTVAQVVTLPSRLTDPDDDPAQMPVRWFRQDLTMWLVWLGRIEEFAARNGAPVPTLSPAPDTFGDFATEKSGQTVRLAALHDAAVAGIQSLRDWFATH